ncbi:aldehyde dehydrogenase family 3 member F1-like isoform X3 [Cornus florida]|uniref:aldehyde dehydrogenase family 3 member F1-like isoform X3 n=1 Tax=Cornus florida TaxID=4283 RepID=UPI002897FAA8|nr:aldehyde dehydrogenase family 3 member F1-like isoform X3 [Cornus florida]
MELEGEVGLGELRQCFRSGSTRSVSWRKAQLEAILKLITDNEDKMFKALQQDLGKHPDEAYRDEIGAVVKSANNSLSSVEKWMAPQKAIFQLLMMQFGQVRIPVLFFPAKGEVLPEPLGLALIFSSWNFPILSALDPLIGAISAGNAAVLKPSKLAPACSSFLANTIPLYLDNKAIKVIEGGADIAEKVLQQKWDKIFFTGSPRVGRIVMSAAAEHLTPVTLELGGKCPIILDSLTNLSDIQIDSLKRTMKKFYGDNPKSLNNLSRIVNKHHFDRLHNLLEDPNVGASIVHGGSLDEENLIIEPTILLDPPLDAEIMTEEIFGPLLPIITLNKIQDSIEFINSRPKPLTLYAFTKNEAFKKQILTETSSDTLVFNDIFGQFLCDALPFGGVGQSGIGRYHGKYSFETFSHEKPVLHRSFFPDMEMLYPPLNDSKLQFLRLAYKFDNVGILLHFLGLKKTFT